MGEAGAAPLAGVRVLELARILAGPWAGQMLADLGADVVKVERPGQGDDTRGWGPPFVAAADGGTLGAAYFHACNRGKRSIAVDFETDDGRAVVRRLAARSDVLIENFKRGGLARHGLDYDTLKRDNPRLIYCSITGFGQDGPYAARAGYDFMIQGMGGIMDLTGMPEGDPTKAGIAVADLFTGVYAVAAIEAALLHRARTGTGQHIDMALLDSLVGSLGHQALNFLVSGRVPGRLGNGHPNIVPYDGFAAADGHLCLAVGNDEQFRRLCRVLGVPDLASVPAFSTNADRVRARADLVDRLRPLILGWSRDALLAALAAEGVPAGPINRVDQVFDDPQVRHRGLRLDLPNPAAAGGTVPGVRTPIRMSASPLVTDRPAPGLGQHTDEILAELAREGF